MSRRTLIVYGNCQASIVAYLLAQSPTFTAEIEPVLAINHAPPGGSGSSVPPEAERAALVWEQYDERENVPAREALRASLPSGSRTIVFPPMSGMGLWPFAWADARNQPEPGYPWGRYPWGDRIGMEVAKMNLRREFVYDAYMTLSAAKMPNVDDLLERDRVLAERRDGASDVTIGDFIAAEFRSQHLFWTWGHTASPLNVELTLRLLRASESVLGPLTAAVEGEIRAAGEANRGIGAEQLPFHPTVIERAGLTFRDAESRYEWFGQHWTFREYIERYITLDRSW